MRRILLADFSWLCYAYYFSPLHKRLSVVHDNQQIYTGRTYGFAQLVRSAALAGISEIYFCEDHGVEGEQSPGVQIMEGYKGGREAHPEVWVKEEIEAIKGVVSCHPYVQFARRPATEADDMMAMLFYENKDKAHEITIYSGDNDLLQLMPLGARVSRKVQNGQFMLIGPDYLEKTFPGVPPEHLLRYRILVGDSSDNIPAVVPRLNRKWILEFVKKWSETNLQEALKFYADHPNGQKVIAAHKQLHINMQLMNLTRYRDPVKREGYELYKPDPVRDLLVRYQLNAFQEHLEQNFPQIIS